MKKKSLYYDNEIDLIALLRIIFNGKIKVFLFIAFSFLLGLGYSYLIPNYYLKSLTVSKSDNYKFIKINSILNLISSKPLEISNKIILDRFINELKDYEEFLSNLKNTKKFKENTKNLSAEDQEKALLKNVNLLEIVEPKKNETDFTLNFKWHDSDEANIILKDTLNLVMNNLMKSTYNQLKQILEFEKKKLFQIDRKKLDYLLEQSSIAKELDISDNQIDDDIYQPKVLFDMNSDKISESSYFLNPYYLRGYKAIDKEIELIQNRDYQFLESMEQEINEFKDSDANLIDYNVYLIKTKSLKNTKLILMTSIILGLIIGVFYVLISNAFKSQTASNKNK